MKITIKATQLDLTDPMRQYVEEKIGALEKFISRYDENDAVLVAVEIARTTHHHHKGQVYRAEANMTLPGAMLRAEDSDFDIRVAVNKVKEILQREIEKYKTERGEK